MLDHNLTTQLINLIEDMYSRIPLDIYQSVTQLANKIINTLNHARQNKLTLEQEYLVESIITTELPNIFATYRKISNHSQEAINQANVILRAQIKLLSDRVHTIRTERNDSTVKDMQSQLDYLKSKYEAGITTSGFHISIP